MKFTKANTRKGGVLLPKGKRKITVIGFDIGISNGAKSGGSSKTTLKIQDNETGEILEEVLVDHPSCAFKVFPVLVSLGHKIDLASEPDIDISGDKLGKLCNGRSAIVFVDHREYEKQSGGKGFANEIANWMPPESDSPDDF